MTLKIKVKIQYNIVCLHVIDDGNGRTVYGYFL